ncbi:hypothetical protein ABIC28_001536 [Rhodococcus sp. PvR044]|jgi:hypothetical protein|nr:hypothetical protein [Rhodococcus sp. PvR099]PTR44601.1 hypothetical protein C8K38_10397 [Rhodococcus sp. OK611]SNX90042.1 hypothetical protein SAMN05447004_10497 [Rhodococcus sp. OK270]
MAAVGRSCRPAEGRRPGRFADSRVLVGLQGPGRRGCGSGGRGDGTLGGRTQASSGAWRVPGRPGLTLRPALRTLVQSPEVEVAVACWPSRSAGHPPGFRRRGPPIFSYRWRRTAPIIYEECSPWPRASGRSSRTTDAARVFTASVSVCVPVPGAPSFLRVAKRAALPSPPDPDFGSSGCYLSRTGCVGRRTSRPPFGEVSGRPGEMWLSTLSPGRMLTHW